MIAVGWFYVKDLIKIDCNSPTKNINRIRTWWPILLQSLVGGHSFHSIVSQLDLAALGLVAFENIRNLQCLYSRATAAAAAAAKRSANKT